MPASRLCGNDCGWATVLRGVNLEGGGKLGKALVTEALFLAKMGNLLRSKQKLGDHSEIPGLTQVSNRAGEVRVRPLCRDKFTWSYSSLYHVCNGG
jgi:hypothetical protein